MVILINEDLIKVTIPSKVEMVLNLGTASMMGSWIRLPLKA